MQTNILNYLEETSKNYSDKIAVKHINEEITYGQLIEKSKKVGSALINHSVRDCAVAVFMEKQIMTLCGFFGIVYAGAYYSLIDVNHPEARIKSILEVLKPKVIITNEKNFSKINGINFTSKILLIEELEKNHVCEVALDNEKDNFISTRPLYINFTSGSTGVPKGVAISHQSVVSFINSFVQEFGICSSDVIANQAPFDFDVSVKDIYSCIATGATLVLIPRSYFTNTIKLMDYICEKHTTIIIWAVSAMCFISSLKGFQYKIPQEIRKVMFSGEIMPMKHLKIWIKALPNTEFVNLYGPTEITCNCTFYRISKYDLERDMLPIGKTFKNVKVFLLDENNQLITKKNVNGEICVSGNNVGIGYYNDIVSTNEKFIQNPINNIYFERIYRTGDIGKYDESKNLYYVCRKDFQVKHLGHRIELNEIEIVANNIIKVERSCCFYDYEKSKIILVYVGNIEKEQLLKEMRIKLPHFMLPSKFLKLMNIPINKNGKIDRKLLKKILEV